jgi:hypothetical protein
MMGSFQAPPMSFTVFEPRSQLSLLHWRAFRLEIRVAAIITSTLSFHFLHADTNNRL